MTFLKYLSGHFFCLKLCPFRFFPRTEAKHIKLPISKKKNPLIRGLLAQRMHFWTRKYFPLNEWVKTSDPIIVSFGLTFGLSNSFQPWSRSPNWAFRLIERRKLSFLGLKKIVCSIFWTQHSCYCMHSGRVWIYSHKQNSCMQN